MVILRPHCLEGGVLKHFLVAPADSARVGLVYALACLRSNDWHAAEPAMVPVALMDSRLVGVARHPLLGAKFLCQGWLGRAMTDVNLAVGPNGLRPSANLLHVGEAKELLSYGSPVLKMSRYSGI
jgi:hypothetical protein